MSGFAPLGYLAGAIAGNTSASQELAQYLHKQIVKGERGTSGSAQEQGFIQILKKFSDSSSLESMSPEITEYLQEYDTKSPDSTNNPKLPSPNTTNLPPPQGKEGTSNPFFNINPMTTFFSTFLNVINLMGRLAQIQTLSGMRDQQMTLSDAKDQANAILQGATAQANSLTQQASLEYGMAGVSFFGAATTLVGGLHEAGEVEQGLKQAEQTGEELENRMSTADKLLQNPTKQKTMADEGQELEGALNDVKAKKPPPQGTVRTQAEQDAANKVKIKQLRSQDDIEKDVKANDKEIKDLNTEDTQLKQENDELDKKIQAKEAKLKNKNVDEVEINRINAKKARGEDLTKAEKENLKDTEDVAKMKQQKNINTRKMERNDIKKQIYGANKKNLDVELQKVTGGDISRAARVNTARIAAEDEETPLLQEISDELLPANRTTLLDTLGKEGAMDDQADLLEMKQMLLKNQKNRNDIIDPEMKNPDILEKQEINLKAQQTILKQRQDLLADDKALQTKKLQDSFNKVDPNSEFQLNTAEQEDLFKNNDLAGLKRSLAKDKDKLSAHKTQLLNRSFNTQGWKFQTWDGIKTGINSSLGAAKDMAAAQGAQAVGQWKYQETLDAAYQSMMSQAMQAMLDNAKGSFDAGASYAQALMGFSDKGSSIVHWSA